MRISVTFRNMEGENWQREYIDDRLLKLKKYIDNPVEARVILSVEKFRNVAEVNLVADGLNMNAKEEAKDMHLAIDNAIEKIEIQLKKRKEKRRSQKTNSGRNGSISEMDENVEEIDETLDARVVETRKITLKPMSIDEAIMEIEALKKRFIIYRDSSTENVSLVYLRDDGKYIHIETRS
jgi:putative sigma-54 modulation protein